MTDPQLPPPYGATPPVPPVPPVAPEYQVPQAAPGYPAPQAPHAAPGYPAPQAPQAAPGYPAPQAAPGYSAPQAAPPGAYQVPVGGYTAPAGAYTAPDASTRKSGLLGTLSLIFGLIAAVVMPIIAGVTGFEIGRMIPQGIDTSDPDFVNLLSPVRDQVLWAELAFWTGTILGIAAIVLGIIAIKKKQGRGQGIGGLIAAVLGPVIFWVVLIFVIAIGGAAGITELNY